VQLYKYNGNLLHLCTFASLNVSPATEISAGGKFWSACGNGKSAGEKSFCQPVEEVVRRQKEKGCHSICATRTFHITWVTSEPKLLQNVCLYHPNGYHCPLSAGLQSLGRSICRRRPPIRSGG